MRKRTIYLLMAIISTVLVLLIVIQVVWLRTASEAEAKQQHMTIDKALARVRDQLKTGSFCFESFGKTYIDSGERFYMMHENGNGHADTMEIYYDEAFTRDKKVGKMNTMELRLPFALDIQLRATVFLSDTASYIQERREGNNGTTLNDVLRSKIPIDSIYNMVKVDSLLRVNLANEITNNTFGFGIINPEAKSIVYYSPHADTSQLKSSPYQVSLFSDNRFISPYILSVVFSADNQIYHVNYLLLLSIAMILLLTLSFYAFIRLYLKQSHLSQMKSDFIHNLTHEFNTPMANISLALETLEYSDQQIDVRTRKVLSIIATESGRLRENIERSLQVAVMEDGALLLHKEDVDVVQLLNAVIASYAFQCESLGGSIKLNYSSNPIIKADETHLLNCVVNLLDNAIKYRNQEPTITITLDERDDRILLSVADNGIGMNSETQKHIFDKFYRAHEGDTHNTKGFGLGLSYVKGIIDAHGGTIDVWSKKGCGTRFTLTLPKKNSDGK
jgi:two-component system, OmpR family, phosphate regulon sensor histidine kinase PhoR